MEIIFSYYGISASVTYSIEMLYVTAYSIHAVNYSMDDELIKCMSIKIKLTGPYRRWQ